MNNTNSWTFVASSPLLALSGKRHFPQCDVNSDDFTTVGWLVTNSEKRSPADLWQRTVAAVFLTHCLEAGGYPIDWSDSFSDFASETTGEESIRLPASCVAALLLHLIQAISSNAHTFTAHVHSFPNLTDVLKHTLHEREDTMLEYMSGTEWTIDLENIGQNELGSGLYPILSLLNHSCDPNTTQVYRSDGSCALFALRTIKSGEALYSNYGFHYAVHQKELRSRGLVDQYYFTCKCNACRDDWKPAGPMQDWLPCQQCKKPFLASIIPGLRGNQCVCTLRLNTKRYSKWHLQVTQEALTIPQAYSKLPRYSVPVQKLDEHIKLLSRLLNAGLNEVRLIRPSWSMDYMQEMLKILLDIRYGYWYTEATILATH